MIRFLLIFSVLSLLSCSMVGGHNRENWSNLQRYPAGQTSAECNDSLMSIFKKGGAYNIDDKKVLTEIERKGELFWRNHKKLFLLNPGHWGIRFRRIMTKLFQVLNGNRLPIYYLMDSEETLAKVLKSTEGLKKISNGIDLDDDSIEKKAIKEVMTWLDDYKSYKERITPSLQTVLSYDVAIEQLKSARFQRPIENQFSHLVIDGKVEVRTFNLTKVDEDGTIFGKLEGHIDNLKREREKYLEIISIDKLISREIGIDESGNSMNGDRAVRLENHKDIRKKSLNQIQVEQARNKQRLIFLQEKLRDLKETREFNGNNIDESLSQAVLEIDKALKDETLEPSRKFKALLINQELGAEFKNLSTKVTENERLIQAKDFLRSLTDEEKRGLGIDNAGVSGQISEIATIGTEFVKKNKAYAIVGTVITGGAFGWEEAIEIYREIKLSDKAKFQRCIVSESDEEFYECSRLYLEDEFKLKYPLTYIKGGLDGLKQNLENEEEQNEFIETWESFVAQRAEHKKNIALEAQAKEDLDQFFNEYMERTFSEYDMEKDEDGDIDLNSVNNVEEMDDYNDDSEEILTKGDGLPAKEIGEQLKNLKE